MRYARFLLALAAVLFLNVAGFAQTAASATDPETIARTLITQLGARQYDKAEAQFDQRMSTAVPLDKLTGAWESILAQAGAFQAIKSMQSDQQKGMHVVIALCQFAQASVKVKVAIDAQGKVAGLFFAPGESSEQGNVAWTPPDYARQSAFTEKAVTVGSKYKLKGVLTLPNGKGPFPAVVLVQGSGPHDEDETVDNNKPFKDLAWGLASEGVAVLRYNKRTQQYPKESLETPNFSVRDETTDDVNSAVAQLATTPEIEAKHIFVLGHSLGGMMAPRIAANDKQVAGIVIMAGTARPLQDVILDQVTYLANFEGKPTPEGQQQIDAAQKVKTEVESPTLKPDTAVSILGTSVPGSYFLDLRGYKPAEVAAKLQIPILILQGGRDYQVNSKDYDVWKAALGKDPHVTFKFYPGLFHLFMTGTGKGPGSPEDYTVTGHVDQQVIQDVAQWVKSNSK